MNSEIAKLARAGINRKPRSLPIKRQSLPNVISNPKEDEASRLNGRLNEFPAERAAASIKKPAIIGPNLFWTGMELISKEEHAKRTQALTDNTRKPR